MFLVFHFPNVVGAGLQTLSLQRFPLSHFSFLFKYSLHSSCSSWPHSFPTAGIKYVANALIQSSHTLGVLALNAHFLLSIHYKIYPDISVHLLRTFGNQTLQIYYQHFFNLFRKMKMEVKRHDIKLLFVSGWFRRHKLGILSMRRQSMRQKSMKLMHAACDPMTLSSVMCLCAFYAQLSMSKAYSGSLFMILSA